MRTLPLERSELTTPTVVVFSYDPTTVFPRSLRLQENSFHGCHQVFPFTLVALFDGIMEVMIIDESMGAKGAKQRAEVFVAYCKEYGVFHGSVRQRTIVHHGKEYTQDEILSEDDEIADALAYNIASEYAQWKDIVRDGRIVGMDLRNRYSGYHIKYILPEWRDRGASRRKLFEGSESDFKSKLIKILSWK